MAKTATKAANSMYYLARMKASKKDSSFKSRTSASELLNINDATLAKYELGKLRVHDQMVMNMCEHYKSPELANWYCANECAIGRAYKEDVQLKDIEVITLQAVKNLRHIDEAKNNLVDIISDGKVDESEIPILNNIRQYFLEIRTIFKELDLWALTNIETKEKAHQISDAL